MNRYLLYILLLLLSTSCIEKFELNEKVEFKSNLVVDGLILDDPINGLQEIRISRSSELEEADYLPESGCNVIVYGIDDGVYTFSESETLGLYQGIIPQENLKIGTKFWLEVITPDGKNYLSTEEEMFACPAVDEVYYEVINKPTTELSVNSWGVDYFVDFIANENYGSYYRFSVHETFEYHSAWPIHTYITEENEFIRGPIDYSKYVCYKSSDIEEIFTLSTSGYTHNSFIKYPLHFVDTKDQALKYNYSILLSQYSLSKGAFLFWNDMSKNNQSSVDMFGVQPIAVKGNVFCSGDNDEEVLGYFGVSSVMKKRVSIAGGLDIPFEYKKCRLVVVEQLPLTRPLYLQRVEKDDDGNMGWGVAGAKCYDCTLKGGVVNKPDFFE